MQLTSNISADITMTWQKVLLTCNNPLELTEEMLQQSLKSAPPLEFEGATYLGRYIVPRQFVRYDEEEQPRDKNNEVDHVNDLVNNFEAIGYRLDAQPPIACFDQKDTSKLKLKGQSGFNRSEALDRFGQECYFFDVYDYDSLYWEIVARNVSNHHSNPQLSQKWTDYQKEVVGAVKQGAIPATKDAIDAFVDLIAKDKTCKVRKRIKDACYNTCEIYPNFRTYNSTGHGKNTLNGFINENKFAKQGVDGRTDEDLIKQGYIIYCSGEGDNKATWGRAITHATRLGIPVWFIGYSNKRVVDLEKFRENYIKDFNEQKELFIQFAKNVLAEDGEYSEEDFPVKLAGFMGQYVKPNPMDQGRPTEYGLVDMYGKSIKLDPDGECLTLTQPIEEDEEI